MNDSGIFVEALDGPAYCDNACGVMTSTYRVSVKGVFDVLLCSMCLDELMLAIDRERAVEGTVGRPTDRPVIAKR